MATLKITAKADVNSAKASIRELTQAEANLLAKEKEANLQRRLDYAKTTKEQLALRKQAGDASKAEIASLRQAERLAAADAKQAAREVAQARRDASRAASAELADTIRRGQDFTRERRKLGPSAPKPGAAGGGGDDGFDAAMLGKYGRFAGPGAAVAAGTALVTLMGQMLEELRQIRTTMAEQTVKTGERSLGLAAKAREAGMSDRGISDVVRKVQFRPGSLSTDELSDIAEKGLAEGYTDPGALSKYIETEAAKREKATTPEERLALASKGGKRQAEIRSTMTGRELAAQKAQEDIAKFNRDAFYNEEDGGRMHHRIAATFDTWMAERGFSGDADELKAAGGREQFYNQRYNEYAGRYGGAQITVRLDPQSVKDIAGRPLSGD
jgi:hypothetical protein